MDKLSRLVGIGACVTALAAAGCSSSSGVTPSSGVPMTTQQQALGNQGWIHDGGVTYHTPHYMATRYMAHSDVKPDLQLVYSNGPVLVAPKAYVIFWGFKAAGDPNKVKPLLKKYTEAMGASGHNNIYTQYYQIVGGTQTFITNPRHQASKTTFWSDDTNPIPTHPTDSQVATESLAGVAHFGYDPNGSYVVVTAHNHSSSGFGTSYCAYHSATTSGGKLVSYTNLPYQPDAGSSCGANYVSPPSDETGADEGVTIVEGHEYGESVTDPNPPSGWYNNQEGEIGDICVWGSHIANDPFAAKIYTSQSMFSNATSSCVHSYP
ncbi:MAG: hypothetical protein WB615_13505 [Candidatus Tumulicola sp.]